MPMEFRGRATALSANGFAAAAQKLGTKAPEIWAVLAVETSGCGFLPDGRPQILFERHIFHRLTQGRFDDGDISASTPGGYGPPGARQYDRLAKALSLDRTAALKSASWGIGQIMGENCAMAGFPDVQSMVAAMSETEDAQLSAVANFLIASRLAASLQTHDWTSFARGYNGPGYAKNNYDVRLRGEYAKASVGQTPDLDVRAAQLYLQICGLSPGPVDGFLGRQTQDALASFQQRENLPATGALDPTALARLAQVASAGY